MHRKAWLAAGLIMGAAALTGCAAATKPAVTPTPQAAQQQTAQPTDAQTAESPAPDTTEEPEQQTARIEVNGEEIGADALNENGELLLPLEETAGALGWAVRREDSEEEEQTKRTIALEKDDSRITVAWTVSDNTIKGITWQKDGLLIPVDARLFSRDDVVYVPAAFFEEAMEVSVSRGKTNVMIATPKPMDTPQTEGESTGENG